MNKIEKFFNVSESDIYREEAKYYVLHNRVITWFLNYGIQLIVISIAHFYFLNLKSITKYVIYMGITFLVFDFLSTFVSYYLFYIRPNAEKDINWKKKRLKKIEKYFKTHKKEINKVFKECDRCTSSRRSKNYDRFKCYDDYEGKSKRNKKYKYIEELGIDIDDVVYCVRKDENGCPLYVNGLNDLMIEYMDLRAEVEKIEKENERKIKQLEEEEKKSKLFEVTKIDKKISRLFSLYESINRISEDIHKKEINELVDNLNILIESISKNQKSSMMLTENYFVYLDEYYNILVQFITITEEKKKEYSEKVEAITERLNSMTLDYIEKSKKNDFEDFDVTLQVLYQEVMKEE